MGPRGPPGKIPRCPTLCPALITTIPYNKKKSKLFINLREETSIMQFSSRLLLS